MVTIYGRTRHQVIKSEITTFVADALVNPSNSLMKMGGGVVGWLLRGLRELGWKRRQ